MIDEIGKSELVVMPLDFPIKGLCVESAAHEQPELTTTNLLNVWIYDGGGVARGAQRAGTTTVWMVPLFGIPGDGDPTDAVQESES